MNVKTGLISALFASIVILFLFNVIADSRLIGRSLDNTVPPTSDLMRNTFNIGLYTWFDGINAGIHNSFGPTLLPINYVLYAPVLVGITDPWFIARYQIALPLFLSLVFFYLLAQQIISTYNIRIATKAGSWVAILVSVFFTFNNYVFTEIVFGSNVLFITFVFIPLFLYFYLRLLSKDSILNIWGMILSLVLISSALQHLVVIYVFFFLLALSDNKLKLFALISGIHVLLSAYWILPIFSNVASIQNGELATSYIDGITSSSSYFLSSLLNMDYFGNRNIYRGALQSDLLSDIWTINAYILCVLALMSTSLKGCINKRSQRLLAIASSIFVLSIIFNTGGREPFGELVIAMYRHFPLMNLFRSTQHYLSFYLVAFSIMLLLSICELVERSKKYFFLITIVALINAMPWWLTGNLGMSAAIQSRIPGFNMYDLSPGNKMLYDLNSDPHVSSIYTIPPTQSPSYIKTTLNKHASQGSDAGLLYNNKKSYEMENDMSDFQPVMNKLEYEVYTNKNFLQENKTLLNLLNVRHIVIREDVRPNFSPNSLQFDTKYIQQELDRIEDYKLVQKLDSVSIIENLSFLPVIYSPTHITISNKEVSELNAISKGLNSINHPAVIFSKQNPGILSPEAKRVFSSFKHSTLPRIEFRKINPTRYIVQASSVKDSFPLIMSNSFSLQWNIVPHKTLSRRLRNDTKSKANMSVIQNDNLLPPNFIQYMSAASLKKETQFIANGYSNGWIVNPSEICEYVSCDLNSDDSVNFAFAIEFHPQRLFYIGLFISLLSGLLVLITSLLTHIYKIKTTSSMP